MLAACLIVRLSFFLTLSLSLTQIHKHAPTSGTQPQAVVAAVPFTAIRAAAPTHAKQTPSPQTAHPQTKAILTLFVAALQLQMAQPLAAKLLSGAQNASYQANASRDAAQQAALDAHQKLASLEEQLQTAKSTKHAAQATFKAAPAQWGVAQFKVRPISFSFETQPGVCCV